MLLVQVLDRVQGMCSPAYARWVQLRSVVPTLNTTINAVRATVGSGAFLRGMSAGLAVFSALASTAAAAVSVGNYEWSNATYGWVEISSTGRKLPVSGDDVNGGPFPIGFDFPFYGRNYGTFRVCSNGFITFLDAAYDATGFANLPLPTTAAGAPPSMIALLWDDLHIDPSASAVFYRLIDAETMVLQFKNVQFAADRSKVLNAELILSSNGKIKMQYQGVGITDSCTVGIQDLSKGNGVQMVYNGDFIKDGTALEVRRLDPPLMSVVASVNAVNVPEGGSAAFEVKLGSQPVAETQLSVSTFGGSSSVTSAKLLTFTPANWNQSQRVDIATGEDSNATNDRSNVLLSGREVTPKIVTAQEIDNDLGVVIGNSPVIPEGAASDLMVKLSRQPQVETFINLAVLSGDRDISLVGPSVISFNSSNWNVYQRVALAAAADADTVNGSAIIRCSGAGVVGMDRTVTEADRDVTVVTNVRTATVPEGQSSVLQVKLSARPAATMDVNVAFLGGDSNLSLADVSALRFTPENWNDFQNVKFSAAEDIDSLSGFALFRFSGPQLVSQDVKVVEVDNDAQAVLVRDQQVPVAEGGSGAIWVRLNRPPLTSVSVAISKVGGGDPDISGGGNVTFTAGDFDVYKPVTLSALPDSDRVNGSATFGLSASGAGAVFVVASEVEKSVP
jgi:hypothetical protein